LVLEGVLEQTAAIPYLALSHQLLAVAVVARQIVRLETTAVPVVAVA